MVAVAAVCCLLSAVLAAWPFKARGSIMNIEQIELAVHGP